MSDDGPPRDSPPGFWMAVCPCGWHIHRDNWGTSDLEAQADAHQERHARNLPPRGDMSAIAFQDGIHRAKVIELVDEGKVPAVMMTTMGAYWPRKVCPLCVKSGTVRLESFA